LPRPGTQKFDDDDNNDNDTPEGRNPQPHQHPQIRYLPP